MPTNNQLQYITYPAWIQAPATWLQNHGFPSPGSGLGGNIIPMLWDSIEHYQATHNNLGPQAPPPQAVQAQVPSPQPEYFQEGNPVDPMSLKQDKTKNKLYNIPLTQAFKTKFSNKIEEGEIGLEIECEGMNLFNTPISYWTTHADGSLRAYKDHPPIEYVLRKPLVREEVPKALTYLSKKLKAAGSHIHESTRTSVHVHVNCQSLTIKQIYQFWCLYTIFEEILVDFSGPDRPGNLFCLSSKQAEYQVKMLEQAIQTENFNEVFSDNLRYTSCNTASLGKFGSLEFRSMRGTVDQGLIQAWVDLLLIIKDKSLEYEDPKGIVQDFQKLGPEGFLDKTFGGSQEILAIFKSRSDRHKILWDGLRLMRDVAYAVKWDKRDPSLDKKKEPTIEKVTWISHHTYYTCLEHIEDHVFLMMHDSGNLWLVNYGTGTAHVNWMNEDWQLSERHMYRVNSTGLYLGNHHTLSPQFGEPTIA